MKNISIILALVFYTTVVHSNQCNEILQYSQITSKIISNKSDFESQVEDFCDEYKSSEGITSNSSLGIKYKVLSLNSSGGKTSTKQLYKKYCKNKQYERKTNNDFNSYIKSINPRGYSAYQSCISASKDLTYKWNNKKANGFTVNIGFNSSTSGTSAKLYYSVIPDKVNCSWWRGHKGKEITFKKDEKKVVLTCKRDKEHQNETAYITIDRINAKYDPIEIPWSAFNKNGVPIDTIDSFRREIGDISQELNAKTAELEKIQKSLENKVGANTKNISPTYDTGWLDVKTCGDTIKTNIGFEGLPYHITAYYKYKRKDGSISIIPWGTNQYGDGNQANGIVMDFDEKSNLYIRQPCGNTKFNGILHLGRYKDRDNIHNKNISHIKQAEFKVMVWKAF